MEGVFYDPEKENTEDKRGVVVGCGCGGRRGRKYHRGGGQIGVDGGYG